ncbi:hypothetical protein [Streptomyces europaeiscabiei]|nr:hypothetical protein [Streptomyces europaeiscabiei]MDX3619389.1 hypothetical protein [Streptomyces europaeiscabiei]MDX3637509.1 hypothetical protein [Streptomyces europaeiscabiei]MDX3655570.1 hypothetical protein [Streptomyces europaeiscabiei]WUD35159.1 hypothetical protein OG858_29595 [Streptomyces europaeiscabiei]
MKCSPGCSRELPAYLAAAGFEAELKQFNGEQDHIRRYLGQYIENQRSPI